MYKFHCSHQQIRKLLFVVGLWVMGLMLWNEGVGYAEIPASHGKAATASSVTGSTYDAGRAVDGLLHTAWKAGDAALPQWLTVDLGQQVNVRRVETVYENPASYYQYRIETSADGLTWTGFADKSSNTSGSFPKYVDSGDVLARYVRLTTTGVGTPGDTAAVYQFDVYASQAGLSLLSQNKTAIAYSTFGPGWEAAKAVDGQLGTRWAPAGTLLPQWLVVDLGQVNTVLQVETTFDNKQETYRYKVEFSTDGIAWYTFADRTGNTLRNEPRYVDQGHVNARYIRVTTVGVGALGGYFGVAELQVYGVGSGTGTGTTPSPTANPTGIAFTEASYSITAGATRLTSVTAAYANQASATLSSGVTFTSSNTGVATVSAAGVIQGVAPDTATITATYGGVSANASVTVTSAQHVITGIYMDAYSYALTPYGQRSIAVSATYQNGETTQVTSSTVFSSSNSSVATVSSTGTISAWTAGTAYITATHGGYTATSTVTVSSRVSSLSASDSSLSLAVGGSELIYVTGYQSDGSSTTVSGAQFTSSNSTVASVGSSGYVTGLSAGYATITITYEALSTTVSVHVTGQADTTAPAWPTGASLNASETSSSGVKLSWTAAQDTVGVTSYKLYQDSSELTTLGSGTLTYQVNGLTPGNSYTFTVEAVDAAGHWSSGGPSVMVQTLASPAVPLPSPPQQSYETQAAKGMLLYSQLRKEPGLSGEEVATAYINSEEWAKAAAAVEGHTGVLLTIQAQGEAGRTATVLPLDVLSQLALTHPEDAIAIQTEAGTVTLPLRMLSRLTEQEGLEQELTVTTRIANGAESGLTNQLTAQAGISRRLLPAPVEVQVMLNGQLLAEHEGMELTLTLPETPGAGGISAKWLDLEQGRYGFVPSRLVHENGAWRVVLKMPRGHLFTIVEASRSFEDMKQHWAKKDIEQLAAQGVISGVSDTRFEPDAELNRAQFAALLIRTLGLEYTIQEQEENNFHDVKPGDWYASAVASAVSAGLIEGYEDGSFKPLQQVTREQMAAMALRAMQLIGSKASLASADTILAKYKDRSSVGTWAKDALAINLQNGLMPWVSTDTLTPQSNVTRAQAGVTLSRLLQRVQYYH